MGGAVKTCSVLYLISAVRSTTKCEKSIKGMSLIDSPIVAARGGKKGKFLQSVPKEKVTSGKLSYYICQSGLFINKIH